MQFSKDRSVRPFFEIKKSLPWSPGFIIDDYYDQLTFPGSLSDAQNSPNQSDYYFSVRKSARQSQTGGPIMAARYLR